MAVTIRNSANVTFNYAGKTGSAVSNVATATLLDAYGLTAQKLSQNAEWRPAENLTYTVSVENNGTEPIYAISIQDDLGGAAPLMSYVAGSARLILGGAVSELTPTAVSPLTLVLPNVLRAGETALFSYVAKVDGNIDATITDITNVVTVAGHELSEAGPVITVTPSPSLTLPRASYAEVSMEKTANKPAIFAGERLTFIFKLENSGNMDATGVTLRDSLPAGFAVESIQSETNGVVTDYAATDYSLTADNRLILPTTISKLMTVPAATASGNGVTTVSIVGVVTA